MRDLLTLTIHLLVTCIKLLRSGGVRAVAAESLLLKHQILISNRSRRRAPLTTLDRVVLGLTTFFIRPQRISKLSALLATATLLKFHKALVDRKYRVLFSSTGNRGKLGPKRSCPELVAAITALKSRILSSVAFVLPNRSPMHSVLNSTKTSFGACWTSTIGPTAPALTARPG